MAVVSVEHEELPEQAIRLRYMQALLARNQKVFASRQDRLRFHGKFYEDSRLKARSSLKSTVAQLWKNLRTKSIPNYIKRGVNEICELYRQVWKRYHAYSVEETAQWAVDKKPLSIDSDNSSEHLPQRERQSKRKKTQPKEPQLKGQQSYEKQQHDKKPCQEPQPKEPQSEEPPRLVPASSPVNPKKLYIEYQKMRRELIEQRHRIRDTVKQQLALVKDYDEMLKNLDASMDQDLSED